MRRKSFSSLGFERHHKQTRRERLAIFIVMDLSRIYAAPITHLGCLAFESQGAFAS